MQASVHWHIKEIILALKSFEIDLLAPKCHGTLGLMAQPYRFQALWGPTWRKPYEEAPLKSWGNFLHQHGHDMPSSPTASPISANRSLSKLDWEYLLGMCLVSRGAEPRVTWKWDLTWFSPVRYYMSNYPWDGIGYEIISDKTSVEIWPPNFVLGRYRQVWVNARSSCSPLSHDEESIMVQITAFRGWNSWNLSPLQRHGFIQQGIWIGF